MTVLAANGDSLQDIVRRSAQTILQLDLPETFTHGSLFCS